MEREAATVVELAASVGDQQGGVEIATGQLDEIGFAEGEPRSRRT